jgi:choline dehydrogenase-like flavoprotein
MWTVVQFELRSPEYRTAFDVLAGAGFAPHRRPGDGSGGPFPAAVVRDLFQDPAVVTRAVFEALDEAGLAPVAVAAAHVRVGADGRGGAALAPA